MTFVKGIAIRYYQYAVTNWNDNERNVVKQVYENSNPSSTEITFPVFPFIFEIII